MAKVRRFIRKHGSSMKTSGANATGGLLVSVIDAKLFQTESGKKMLGDSTYIKPILIGVVGHFAKSKAPNVGAGMLGAAGFMLGQSYFASSAASSSTTTTPETKGLVDAGALHNPARAFAEVPQERGFVDTGAIYEYAGQ